MEQQELREQRLSFPVVDIDKIKNHLKGESPNNISQISCQTTSQPKTLVTEIQILKAHISQVIAACLLAWPLIMRILNMQLSFVVEVSSSLFLFSYIILKPETRHYTNS